MYRRTKTNPYLALLVLPAVIVAVWGTTHGMERRPLTIVVVTTVLVLLTTLVFSSLTVEVADGELRFHFALGFWKKRYPVADIVRATPTRSAWWEGLGIRITPRGWLYTVSGGPAVEITPRGKAPFRLGTPEPEAVVAAIEAERGPGEIHRRDAETQSHPQS
jgi:hypothetical protein